MEDSYAEAPPAFCSLWFWLVVLAIDAALIAGLYYGTTVLVGLLALLGAL